MVERTSDRIHFDSAQPVTETIAQEGAMRVVLFCLDAGQEIPVHKARATVLMQVFSGRGVLLAGDREQVAQAGDLVIVPPMAPHAMFAREGRFTVLACIVSTAD